MQAGPGTGKSLGYLAPALAHLYDRPRSRIVVATGSATFHLEM